MEARARYEHHFARGWSERAAFAARIIRKWQWVCDLGCGRQTLRSFLPREAVYLPADLTAWSENVEPCDLDAAQFPERSLLLADITVMLGVLEHLHEPDVVLAGLAVRTEHLFLSYHAFAHQKRPEWANFLTGTELEALLRAAGFTVLRFERFRGRQGLYLGKSRSYPKSRRAMRAAARADFSREPWSAWVELKRAADRFAVWRHGFASEVRHWRPVKHQPE